MHDDAFDTALNLAEAIARAQSLDTVWEAADLAYASLIGHRLFTVLVYEADQGLVRRQYSNRPDEYPVSGTKPMGATPWGEHVLHQGKPYIGRDAADIRWAFFDHELIASMGLASTCNLPVRAFGRTLGTINLLHEAGHYDDDCLTLGMVLAGLLAPAMAKAQPSNL